MRSTNKSKKKRFYHGSTKNIRKLIEQRWLVVFLSLALTGLGAALAGLLFKEGIYQMVSFRIEILNYYPNWLVLPILGALGGMVSGWLVSNFAPAAGGAGITHIMSFLRHRPVQMGLKVALVKLVAGIIAIGSGFPLGPEGPAVQMGGSVAWQLARWLRAPGAFRRMLVSAGGGAGIAAVFSAPIGGFIYAIEELLHVAKPVVLLLVLVTTFFADTSADVLGFLGLGHHSGGLVSTMGFQLEREYTPQVFFFPIDLVYLIALGGIAGLLTELYSRYVLALQHYVNLLLGRKLVLRMSITGLALGGFYAALPSIFQNPAEFIHLIAEGSADLKLALAIFAVLFFSTGLAAASGAPGGLFLPMLTLGGAIGLACGDWVESLTGHVPTTFVFAGMGAFVAGCSRTPISAMFLAFALTKDLLILKPILVACLASYLVAVKLDKHSIYERQMRLEIAFERGNGKEVDLE